MRRLRALRISSAWPLLELFFAYHHPPNIRHILPLALVPLSPSVTYASRITSAIKNMARATLQSMVYISLRVCFFATH